MEELITVDNKELWRLKMKHHVTFLLATLAACSAHSGGKPRSGQELDPHVYCGRRLARMLAAICDYDERRAGSGSMLHPILAPYYKAQDEYGWPYVTSHKLKNQEFLPHKMDLQTDWPQKSESQYIWPFKTGSYSLISHKAKGFEDWPVRKSQDAEGWPWLTPHKARGLDLLSKSKSYVVSACCENPCTLDELLAYC